MARKPASTVIYACAFCRKEITNPYGNNVAAKVEGWVTHRKGGGTHHIRQQRKLGPVAHITCLGIEFDPASQMNEMFPDG